VSLRRKLGFKAGAVTPAPWNPLLLHPYAGWDALLRPDLITVGGGNAVSSWKDIVAGYDLMQATGAAQPIYSATGFNGSPVVTGDGVDDELTLTGIPSGIPTGASPIEMWWVVDQQVPAANTTALSVGGMGGSAETTSRRLIRFSNGTVNRPRLRDSSASDLSGVAADFGGRIVVRTWATGTEIGFQANGLSATTARVSAIGTDRIRLFANPVSASAVGFWAGGFSALWIMPPLTTDQVTQMFAYFNARI